MGQEIDARLRRRATILERRRTHNQNNLTQIYNPVMPTIGIIRKPRNKWICVLFSAE